MLSSDIVQALSFISYHIISYLQLISCHFLGNCLRLCLVCAIFVHLINKIQFCVNICANFNRTINSDLRKISLISRLRMCTQARLSSFFCAFRSVSNSQFTVALPLLISRNCSFFRVFFCALKKIYKQIQNLPIQAKEFRIVALFSYHKFLCSNCSITKETKTVGEAQECFAVANRLVKL